MNKTIPIRIGGRLMHADEDAYLALQRYLDSLSRQLGQTEGREEIMADIESRMAEIWQESWGGTTRVLSLQDANRAMEILGKPEDMAGTEATNQSGSHPQSKRLKRLFRDGENRVIGGVCSGLSAYLVLDVVLVRVAFVLLLLFTGIGFLAYLILWVATPKASSTADRLSMHGEVVNIESIKRKVSEELKSVESALTEPGRIQRWETRLRERSILWTDRLGDLSRIGLRWTGYLLVFVAVLWSISWLLALTVLVLGGNELNWPESGTLLWGAVEWDQIPPKTFKVWWWSVNLGALGLSLLLLGLGIGLASLKSSRPVKVLLAGAFFLLGLGFIGFVFGVFSSMAL